MIKKKNKKRSAKMRVAHKRGQTTKTRLVYTLLLCDTHTLTKSPNSNSVRAQHSFRNGGAVDDPCFGGRRWRHGTDLPHGDLETNRPNSAVHCLPANWADFWGASFSTNRSPRSRACFRFCGTRFKNRTLFIYVHTICFEIRNRFLDCSNFKFDCSVT